MFSFRQNYAEEKPRQKEGRGRRLVTALELSYLHLSITSRVAQAL